MKSLKCFLTIIMLTVLLVISVVPLPAQTPQYYNYSILEHNNSFPFATISGKGVQWLYPPGNLNQPALVRSGVITKVYFYTQNANVNADFWNISVKLGQSAIMNLPSGVIYTGPLDTVYFRTYENLASNSDHWLCITLDNPFLYDSTQSLIVDVSQCGATNSNLWICQHVYTGIKRTYYDYTPYVYRGQDSLAVNFGVDIVPFVGIKHSSNAQPTVYLLDQNYPNPFNQVTTISYSIPKEGNVNVTVFDVLGRELYVLANEFKKAGTYNIHFNASDLSSGVYFYRMESGNFREVKKMTLVK
jgi:hypothetical protein